MSNFEEFVQREIGIRLQGDTYLDYAASGLYTNTQIDEFAEDLKQNMYGNPHSLSSSSRASTEAVEGARSQVLRFFNASSAEYEVVFTRSCTDSLRLLADVFPWKNGSDYKYLLQSHNSAIGIREVARSHSATAGPIAPGQVDAWLEMLAAKEANPAEESALSLFEYPPEENFAGEMFPFEWTSKVVSRRGALRDWRVVLDAAKFSATHPLSLSQAQADFVVVSFYKIFGHPTGVGALIIKQSVASELKKCYWGGGSIRLAGVGRSPVDDFQIFKHRTCERFEDGTVSFLGIAALKHGFAALDRVGGMKAIEKHTSALTDHLAKVLQRLRHGNGRPVVTLYGGYNSLEKRARSVHGSIVNFNVLRPDGSIVSHIEVMESAAKAGIHLRAGAHCNPGAASMAFGMSPELVAGVATDSRVQSCGVGPSSRRCPSNEIDYSFDTSSCRHSEMCIPTFLPQIGKATDTGVDVPLGSVRASIGYLTTYEDVMNLVGLLRHNYIGVT
eukprot:TRINITY_DN12563_c0_g2_i1.p1 TRINITY_DN12563_c0_g2~~TRINITY_DN12563_c0_g2_i1.p1  ORF type:complete len:560 (-),score=62.74 TRINITY_DN12563_c0_g2_i1:127-1629(-)